MRIIGIGTDIIEIDRVANMIDKHGDTFFRRVFTDEEVRYSSARAKSVQHFAGRFAAKEAVLKSIGTGWAAGIKWNEIEVTNDGSGRPLLELTGRAREVARELGIDEVLISISHSKNYAIAFATAVQISESATDQV